MRHFLPRARSPGAKNPVLKPTASLLSAVTVADRGWTDGAGWLGLTLNRGTPSKGAGCCDKTVKSALIDRFIGRAFLRQ